MKKEKKSARKSAGKTIHLYIRNERGRFARGAVVVLAFKDLANRPGFDEPIKIGLPASSALAGAE